MNKVWNLFGMDPEEEKDEEVYNDEEECNQEEEIDDRKNGEPDGSPFFLCARQKREAALLAVAP